MNAETLSELGVNGGVDLGKIVRRVSSGESLSGLGVLRGKALTVTAIR